MGRRVRVPIFGHEVPVLADRMADPAKGTGAVMCCSFGDTTDVQWWRELDLPTLVVWSEKDGIIPVAHARAVHAHLPGSTLVVFPSGGHEPHRRHAAEFADAVAAFVGAPARASGRPDPAA